MAGMHEISRLANFILATHSPNAATAGAAAVAARAATAAAPAVAALGECVARMKLAKRLISCMPAIL